MASPTQLGFQEHCLDTDAFGSLQHLNVGDVVFPFDVENGSEAALMKAFQEADVTAVSNPRFCAIKQGGQNNCSIHTNFRLWQFQTLL